MFIHVISEDIQSWQSNYIVYSTRHANGIDMANRMEKMQQKSRR